MSASVVALLGVATAVSQQGSGSGTASVYEYHDSSIFALVTVVVVVGFLVLFVQGIRASMCSRVAEEVESEATAV